MFLLKSKLRRGYLFPTARGRGHSVLSHKKQKNSTKSRPQYHLVTEFADVGGKDLRDAFADIRDLSRGVSVSFRLSPEGGKRFHELTRKNIGRQLAAILDGRAVSVANIQSAIQSEVKLQVAIQQSKQKNWRCF